MASPPLKILLVLISSVFLSSAASIGVLYRPMPGTQPLESVVTALISAGITQVSLPDVNPATIQAFSNSNISLILSIPNSLVDELAASKLAARGWFNEYVLPFISRVRIATICVGDGVFSPSSSSNFSTLLPAIKNLHSACLRVNQDSSIKVTTSLSFDALEPAFPPSAARFQESLWPLLDYLSLAGSPFLMELQPYDKLKSQFGIPIGYALFDKVDLGFRDDPGTGRRYWNLFDEMCDAAIWALKAAGHEEMPVVVAGTGWPTGDAREATVGYARRYHRGLVEHLRSGFGTPRRGVVAAVYIRELFDDPMAKEQWGIWFSNLTAKYDGPGTDGNGAGADGAGASADVPHQVTMGWRLKMICVLFCLLFVAITVFLQCCIFSFRCRICFHAENH